MTINILAIGDVVGQTGLAFLKAHLRQLQRLKGVSFTVVNGEKPTFTLLDFHAEATSETRAMGWFLDGRVSAVWGTHTHVQTSDARVLPRGTGYISDLGMTGPSESVLGIAPEQSIRKFLGDPPRRYEQAKGPGKIEGAVFTIDTETGACTAVEAIRITP